MLNCVNRVNVVLRDIHNKIKFVYELKKKRAVQSSIDMVKFPPYSFSSNTEKEFEFKYNRLSITIKHL